MAASATFTDSFSTTTSASSWTKTSAALGTPSADRIIALTIEARSGTTLMSISSITIGGVSATQAIMTPAVSGTDSTINYSSLWYAAVPSGTTGNIVITWSGAILRGGFAVYALAGSASSPADAQGSTSTSTTVTVNFSPASNGVVLAAGIKGNSRQRISNASGTIANGVGKAVSFNPAGTGAVVWTGVTADFEVELVASAGGTVSMSAVTFYDAAAGDISGTTNLTFGVSGTLGATADIAGSGALSFAASGMIAATAGISGTTTLSFSPAATISATANVQGSSSLLFTVSGTISGGGAGAISGASNFSFTLSGTLDRPSIGTVKAGDVAYSVQINRNAFSTSESKIAVSVAIDRSAYSVG